MKEEFWHKKIERNMQRDMEVTEQLRNQGWTVLRFWGREIVDYSQANRHSLAMNFD
jgi:G:T-mismatch repair DNA endonuclease (very short patch repair protein)